MGFLLKKNIFLSRLVQPLKFFLSQLKHYRGVCIAIGMVSVLCLMSTESWATAVTTLSGLRTNIDNTFSFAMGILIDLGTISGFVLFFLGIFSVYTSHTKQAAGGKPMSHGLVMIACGAVLIGMPYFFKITSKAVSGADVHQIGSDTGISNFINSSGGK